MLNPPLFPLWKLCILLSAAIQAECEVEVIPGISLVYLLASASWARLIEYQLPLPPVYRLLNRL